MLSYRLKTCLVCNFVEICLIPPFLPPATKLSEKLVKEGIVGLAEKGFILILHTKRKNAYRVLEFWKQREDKTYCEDKEQILNARALYASNPVFSKSKEEKRKERLQRTAKYLSKQEQETEGTGF